MPDPGRNLDGIGALPGVKQNKFSGIALVIKKYHEKASTKYNEYFALIGVLMFMGLDVGAWFKGVEHPVNWISQLFMKVAIQSPSR
jgi:hypothetical protein